MADIRINALATTAASTASDDFIAVDGSANGTRKLNAYSPTFGGNLTVSGTGTIGGNLTVSSGSLSLTSPTGSAATFTNTTDNNWSMKLIQSGGNELQFSGNITGNSGPSIRAVTSGGAAYAPLTVDGSTATIKILGVSALAIDGSKNATLAGNLTVSGTGTSSVAGNLGVGATSTSYKVDVNGSLVSTYTNNPALALLRSTDSQAANKGGGLLFGGVYSGTDQTEFAYIGGVKENGTAGNYAGKLVFGTRANGTGGDDMTRMTLTSGGNFLLGTTTDSGNGKLQLATHTTSAGGIGFGTDTSLNSISAGKLALTYTSSTPVFSLYSSTTERLRIEAVGVNAYISTVDATGNLYLRSGNLTTALTLDSSQNATFAGNAKINSSAAVTRALSVTNSLGNVDIGVFGANGVGYFGTTTATDVQIYAHNAFVLGFDSAKAATFTGTIATQNGTASTPASASATGTAGTIKWDASYIYVCTAANTWKRVAIATW